LLGIAAVAFSSEDSRVAALYQDGRLAAWDIRTGRALFERSVHTKEASSIAFSPDGALIVTSASEPDVRVWDASNGRPVAVIHADKGWVKRVTFNRPGTLLATAGSEGVRIWANPGFTKRFAFRGEVEFSPDGQLIATYGDNAVQLIDSISGAMVHELRGHKGHVTRASFAASGRYLVTVGGGPVGDGRALVWDVTTGEKKATLEGVSDAAFGADDRRLLTVEDSIARIRNWQTGSVLAEVPDAHGAYWTPDGHFILTQNREDVFRLWNPATGKVAINMLNAPFGATIAISSRTQFVAAGGMDQNHRLDDPGDFGLVRLYPCEVCGPLDALLALAKGRVTRQLTSSERELYLKQDVLAQMPRKTDQNERH
jgi:WD40 repeat protein